MKNVARFATLAIAGSLIIGGGALSAQAESAYNSTAVAGITLSVDDYVASVEDVAPAVVTTEAPVAETTEAPAQEQPKQVEDKNADFVAANVDNAVNVRKKKSTEATIVGQMYKGDTGKLLKKGDEWSKIESGNVKGWVKNEFLLFGTQAKEYADKICSKTATVTTTTLNVRMKKSTDADILTQIPEGESYEVAKVSKDGEWVKICIDGDMKGYVSSDFVTLETNYGKALTMEEIEEIQRQNEEAEAAAAQDDTIETVVVTEEVTQTNSSSVNAVSTIKPTKKKTIKKSNNSSGSSFSDDSSVSSSSSSSSSSGSAVANYALQFVGNPYVWGGTSLTNGADCSGFTLSVYAHFGKSLPHSAAAQASCGKSVSTSNLQPGDLVFYGGSGSIGHVGIYIGGGMIVHASNARTGIKTSPYNYRTPTCAVRLFN